MICVVVMTDGRRDCLERSIDSLERQVSGTITRRIIHDDSGDYGDHLDWLIERFGGAWEIWPTKPGRLGFGGAYECAWALVAREVSERFVFSTEDDFTYNRPVDLDELANVLTSRRHLAQIALRRQPWNPAEIAAGGVVEQHPEAYAEVVDYMGRSWLEHRQFFTTNPSLYRSSLCATGWPNVDRSEGVLSARLFRDTSTRCAYWGSRDSGEWVTHIGADRVGTGY